MKGFRGRGNSQRPGTFKKGHKKLGGRKKGTPNRINGNLIERIVQAADQVGSDGKGNNGVDGYLQMLADKKTGYFVGLLRQAVQKQVPATEPENEIVYGTDQDFRQALVDRGVHPTLLPPPPRDLSEKPPINGQLVLPKPPPGWDWILRKKSGSAEVNEEQVDDPNAEDEACAKKSIRMTNPRARQRSRSWAGGGSTIRNFAHSTPYATH